MHYEKDTLVAMARDPRWIFAYWEISEETRQNAIHQYADELNEAELVLRVYDHSIEKLRAKILEIPVATPLGNWYLELDAPGKTFNLELGYLARSGKFIALVCSASVTLPRGSASDMVDSNWPPLDTEGWESLQKTGLEDFAGSSDLMKQFSEELRNLVTLPQAPPYPR